MPELPEVETTCRGLLPHLKHKIVSQVIIRNGKLRWPVQPDLPQILLNQQILDIKRRAKYLLLEFKAGTLMIHLGMSGSLRVIPADMSPDKHDHIDMILNSGLCLRYRDPRRFGAYVWTESSPAVHKLIAHLGPEPLSEDFNFDHLWKSCRGRTRAIKLHIMDSHMVVGVGNIYASEALFMSGIKPTRPANKVSKAQMKCLVDAIRLVLEKAITAGGTTLKDFSNAAGKPGYFAQQLSVYGREGEACLDCESKIKQLKLGQRSSYYCPKCQS